MLHVLGFVALVILAYLGMQYYNAFWLIRAFPRLPLAPGAVHCIALLVAVSFPLSVYLLSHSRSLAAEWFAYLSFIWLGVSLIWLSWALAGDLVLLAARLGGAAERLRPLVAWAVLAATAGLSLYAAWSASRPPRLSQAEVILPGLPRELDGLTVVQLSDLHLGVTVPLSKFARIAAQVNALEPDIIVLTGDFLDPGLRDEEEATRIAAGLRARLGKFAVLGNHEFYHGLPSALACYERCGARLLRNEMVTLPGGLQVAGFDDLMAARVPPEEVKAVLGRLDPGGPSLVLSHQPFIFDMAAAAGAGLTLCGHTHQGQIFPFNLVVRQVYRYFHGLYRKGGSSCYVTSGTGQWGPPMRLFTRAEVVRVTLRSPAR